MEEWLSIAEIAKQLGLAENTCRRYAGLFSDFLHNKQFGRSIKYKSAALEVINRVSILYSEGKSTQEIQDHLREEFPRVIDADPSNQTSDGSTTTTSPPALVTQLTQEIAKLTDLVGHMAAEQERQRTEQGAFNRELLKRLDDQSRYIEQSIKARDESLMQALQEMRESRKAIAAAQENKKRSGWMFWRKD